MPARRQRAQGQPQPEAATPTLRAWDRRPQPADLHGNPDRSRAGAARLGCIILRVFWFPFITVTSGIFGSLVERSLGPSRAPWAWALRLALPFISGLAWVAVVHGVSLAGSPGERSVFARDWGIFTLFALPAWVGAWAVRQTRRED